MHERSAIAHPARDWHIIITAYGVVLLALVIAGCVVYWQGRDHRRFDAATIPSETVTAEQLEALIAKYHALETEHTALLASTSTVADPSASR
jgi:hypothetical protein